MALKRAAVGLLCFSLVLAGCAKMKVKEGQVSDLSLLTNEITIAELNFFEPIEFRKISLEGGYILLLRGRMSADSAQQLASAREKWLNYDGPPALVRWDYARSEINEWLWSDMKNFQPSLCYEWDPVKRGPLVKLFISHDTDQAIIYLRR